MEPYASNVTSMQQAVAPIKLPKEAEVLFCNAQRDINTKGKPGIIPQYKIGLEPSSQRKTIKDIRKPTNAAISKAINGTFL